MAEDESPAALRAELHRVEQELVELREMARGLRQRIGERADTPADDEDLAVLITGAEEQEAILGELAARRAELLRRLAAAR